MKRDFRPIWLYLLVSFGGGILLGIIWGMIGASLDNLESIATIITGIIAFVLFAVLYRKRIIEDLKRLSKKDLLFVLIMAVVLIGGNYLLGLVITEENVNQDAVVDMVNTFPVLSVLVAGILVPFVEEMVFRYSFETILKNKWVFLMVSSLLFALLHIVGLSTIIYAYIGVILCITYLRTNKNIVSSTMVHALNNLFSIIMILLGL